MDKPIIEDFKDYVIRTQIYREKDKMIECVIFPYYEDITYDVTTPYSRATCPSLADALKELK